MFRWRRQRTQHASPGPPPLTHAEMLAWRKFVAECNARLANEDARHELHGYVQRIRHAVIHRRITVEEFLQANPAPWLQN